MKYLIIAKMEKNHTQKTMHSVRCAIMVEYALDAQSVFFLCVEVVIMIGKRISRFKIMFVHIADRELQQGLMTEETTTLCLVEVVYNSKKMTTKILLIKS